MTIIGCSDCMKHVEELKKMAAALKQAEDCIMKLAEVIAKLAVSIQ